MQTKKKISLSTPQQTPVLGSLSTPRQWIKDPHWVDTASGAFEADTSVLQIAPHSYGRAGKRQASCCWEARVLLLHERRRFLGPEPCFKSTDYIAHTLLGGGGSSEVFRRWRAKSADGDPSYRHWGTREASGTLGGREACKLLPTRLPCSP